MTNAEKYKTVEERTEKFIENCLECKGCVSAIKCAECQLEWLEKKAQEDDS